MNITEEVNDTLVKLEPSSSVVIELATPAGQKAKFKVQYIGFLPEHFILLQHPDPIKHPKFAHYLQKCSSCTVRAVIEGHEGMIIAFQTKIKSIATTPTRMVVLAVPVKMAVQHLRKVTRVDTDLSVEAKLKHNFFSGSMLNISPKGCMLHLRGIPDSVALKEADEMEIKVDDERFAKPTKVTGQLCNVKTLNLGHNIGIKFDDRSRDTVMTLINQVLFKEEN